MKQYRQTKRLLQTQIFLLIAFSLYLIFVIGNSGIIELTDLAQIIFLIISQLTIVSFLLFRKQTILEMSNNRSKLIKARLYLITQGIYLEIGISITILLGAVGTLSISPFSNSVVLMVLFVSINILTILLGRLFYRSIEIPDTIRERFDIDSSRYQKIKKLEKMGISSYDAP